jgi:hypothetical protein
MAVVPDAGEPLSPQAADLIRRLARVVPDEPADLMAGVHAAVSAAADEPLRSEPVLAAEVAADWAEATDAERRILIQRFGVRITVGPHRPGARRFDPARVRITR